MGVERGVELESLSRETYSTAAGAIVCGGVDFIVLDLQHEPENK
jgi:hypothetical protein